MEIKKKKNKIIINNNTHHIINLYNIINVFFPNYNNGVILNICNNTDTYSDVSKKIKNILFNWNFNRIIISDNSRSNKFIKYLNSNILYKYIQILLIDTTKIYNSLLNLDYNKYHFGLVILKKTTNKDKIGKLFSIRRKLEAFNYKLYTSDKQYYVFYMTISYPPYYLGDIYNKTYKIINSFISGCGSDGVFLTKHIYNKKKYVMKVCKDIKSYNREYIALNITKNWDYSPKLIYYNNNKLILIIEYCGSDLKTKSTLQKNKYKNKINFLIKDLTKNYGLFHNDIRWKNITLSSKGQLTIIDWGMASKQNNEKNLDKIII